MQGGMHVRMLQQGQAQAMFEQSRQQTKRKEWLQWTNENWLEDKGAVVIVKTQENTYHFAVVEFVGPAPWDVKLKLASGDIFERRGDKLSTTEIRQVVVKRGSALPRQLSNGLKEGNCFAGCSVL